MLDSAFTEFKLDYEGTKNLAIGDFVHSDEISAGGHVWRVRYYPHGYKKEYHGEYLSIQLELVSKSKNVKAFFHVFLMSREDTSSSSSWARAKWSVNVYPPEGSDLVEFPRFVKRSELESAYLTDDGRASFIFGVIVIASVHHNPISVPPSNDIGSDIARLLTDSTVPADVTFSVAGERFPAHRLVLAARSPVFKAQLLGKMADAKMSCITLHDIEAATFQALLRFIYTDALPGDEELSSSPCPSSAIDLLQNLLAAADMYRLERLKITCAQKLWEHVSTDNVASMLGFAELHNCPELKNVCFDFFLMDKNFKKAVVTDGYLRLMQSSPSIIDELRLRIGN